VRCQVVLELERLLVLCVNSSDVRESGFSIIKHEQEDDMATRLDLFEGRDM
jgi:hypothetical protein